MSRGGQRNDSIIVRLDNSKVEGCCVGTSSSSTKVRRRSRWGTATTECAAAAVAYQRRQSLDELVTKLRADETVDNDVAGRVDDDEEVGDDHESDVGRVAAGKIWIDRVDDVDSQRRCSADEEDENDGERNGGEGLLASLRRLQVQPLGATSTQRQDEADVEVDEQTERNEEQRQRVHDARVENSERRRVSDRRLRDDAARVVDLDLEETRNVEED